MPLKHPIINTANKLDAQGNQLTTWEDVYYVTLNLKKKAIKGHSNYTLVNRICIDNPRRKFIKIINSGCVMGRKEQFLFKSHMCKYKK